MRCNRDAVRTPVVVVAAMETERKLLMATLLANSVLLPCATAGAAVAGGSGTAVLLDPPPPQATKVESSRVRADMRMRDRLCLQFPLVNSSNIYNNRIINKKAFCPNKVIGQGESIQQGVASQENVTLLFA